MNTARLLRSLPALVFTWLAVLSLQVAQPGALVHHWEHARGHHAAEAGAELVAAGASARDAAESWQASTGRHAAHESGADPHHSHVHDDCDQPSSPAESGHEGLCNLCAHFAFLGGMQSAQSGIPAVAVAQTLPTARQVHLPPLRIARERYAARAPPALLS